MLSTSRSFFLFHLFRGKYPTATQIMPFGHKATNSQITVQLLTSTAQKSEGPNLNSRAISVAFRTVMIAPTPSSGKRSTVSHQRKKRAILHRE